MNSQRIIEAGRTLKLGIVDSQFQFRIQLFGFAIVIAGIMLTLDENHP